MDGILYIIRTGGAWRMMPTKMNLRANQWHGERHPFDDLSMKGFSAINIL